MADPPEHTHAQYKKMVPFVFIPLLRWMTLIACSCVNNPSTWAFTAIPPKSVKDFHPQFNTRTRVHSNGQLITTRFLYLCSHIRSKLGFIDYLFQENLVPFFSGLG